MRFSIQDMEYEKNDYICIWADRKHKVYVGDTVQEIEFNVEHENLNRYGTLVGISEGVSYPFEVEFPDGVRQFFALVYPVPAAFEKKAADYPSDVLPDREERPFLSREELLDSIRRYQKQALPPYTKQLCWIKHKGSGNILLITGYLTNGVFADSFYSFEDLYTKFEFLDGAICGVVS